RLSPPRGRGGVEGGSTDRDHVLRSGRPAHAGSAILAGVRAGIAGRCGEGPTLRRGHGKDLVLGRGRAGFDRVALALDERNIDDRRVAVLPRDEARGGGG